MKKNKKYTTSSGNIFADLDVANPEERLAKAELAYQINTLIKQRKFTQEEAASFLGIDQPKVSALNKGKLSGFSLERLFRFLNILDQKITIEVTPKKRSNTRPDVSVTFTKKKKTPVRKVTTRSRTVHARKKNTRK